MTRKTIARLERELAGLQTRLEIAQEERDQAERELERLRAAAGHYLERATAAENELADYRRRYRASLTIILELVPE